MTRTMRHSELCLDGSERTRDQLQEDTGRRFRIKGQRDFSYREKPYWQSRLNKNAFE